MGIDHPAVNESDVKSNVYSRWHKRGGEING
jgi:hypothetical protein